DDSTINNTWQNKLSEYRKRGVECLAAWIVTKEHEGCFLDGTLKLGDSLDVRFGISLELGVQDPHQYMLIPMIEPFVDFLQPQLLTKYTPTPMFIPVRRSKAWRTNLGDSSLGWT
ncbi:BgTH12-01116, partial [Blumeria graminis f. sp. triticale]